MNSIVDPGISESHGQANKNRLSGFGQKPDAITTLFLNVLISAALAFLQLWLFRYRLAPGIVEFLEAKHQVSIVLGIEDVYIDLRSFAFFSFWGGWAFGLRRLADRLAAWLRCMSLSWSVFVALWFVLSTCIFPLLLAVWMDMRM